MPLASVFRFLPWSLEGLTCPWVGESLYSYVQAHGVAELPNKLKPDDNKIGWIAGAKDGVISHHQFIPDDPSTEQRRYALLLALNRLVTRSTDDRLLHFCAALSGQTVVAEAEHLEQVIRPNLDPRYRYRVAAVGRYLATKSDDAEVVKFGILLTGFAGDANDRAMLELLATHDEFALFAAQALVGLVSDPEQTLWNVAKRVHGWGRVQVVEMLSGTQDPEICAWMLREGFRNHVMDEYLACICAKTGRLHEALQSAQIDAELLDGAADILRALTTGGPAEDIDDYPGAPEAVDGYLKHLTAASDPNLVHVLCLGRLKYFFGEGDWDKRFLKGWTENEREMLRQQCARQMERPEWIGKINRGLASDDNHTFYEADAAAGDLGISTWEVHFSKVRSSPVASSSWYRLLRQTDAERIDEVLDFAQKALPLSQIASGPADSLGFGKKYEAHRALGWILQDLRRFPERGWPFLKAGLQSPVVSNRNMALNALHAWPRPAWPEEAERVIASALKAEPNEKVKDRLEETLRKK